MTPGPDAVAALTNRQGLRGIITTAADGPGPDRDVVSRYSAPARGILEDPATGSAHTLLAPYWPARHGRRDMPTGLPTSARTGLLRTAVRGDRVHLTGHAVTVPDGTLHTHRRRADHVRRRWPQPCAHRP
ncbi:PhzF family phenazine biosynthesis protein [Streptomyces sp. NBC_00775]|nr:PhzF family phenazine biosynthesis protein [Streptomyces sp. NBC_00775]